MAAKRTTEPVAFTETVHYQYENGGEVVNTLETSVNRPCTPGRDAEKITRVAKVRVETHVVEDKSVENGVVYAKSIKTHQIRDDTAQASSGKVSESPRVVRGEDPGFEAAPRKEEHSTSTLKNMIDNILSDNRVTRVLQYVTLAAAIGALVIAILK